MPLDAPYHRLDDLPRALWLPALTCSAGLCTEAPADSLAAELTPRRLAADLTERRLADLQRWRSALARGELPPADADFGDPQATAPLRAAAGTLGLAALCVGGGQGVAMLVERL